MPRAVTVRLFRRIRLRQNRRRDVLDVACDQQRSPADHSDLRLAIFIIAEPGDIFGDNQIVAAARLEFDEDQGMSPVRRGSRREV